MECVRARQQRQNLRELVAEASRALTSLDADRLEELSLSCQALNRDLPQMDDRERAELAHQALDATQDMAVFVRVLEATRANLNVMHRLHDLQAGRLEYGERLERRWPPTESAHGDN